LTLGFLERRGLRAGAAARGPAPRDTVVGMHVAEAVRARRSIKRFSATPVSREAIEALLSAAALAPNHRLTEPWRFYVLGPAAREAYGRVLGGRKAKKIDDPAAAQATIDTVAAEHRALPAMIVVAIERHANPEILEEDYAAAMMAIENLALVAVEMGLGTHIKTGAIMADPAARAAVGVTDAERIVAIVNVGTPAEVPPAKPRSGAAGRTTWVA
jgi:nitroreductase